MKVAWLLIAACHGSSPAPPPMSPAEQPSWPPPTKPRPATLDGAAALLAHDGHTYAVVRVRAWAIECSNLGGAHWTFDVDGLGPEYALHGGGHGIVGGTALPIDSPHGVPYGPGDPSRFYVAEISTVPLDDVPNEGWCISELHAFNGSVIAIEAARDLTEARAALAAIPTHGFHPVLRIDRIDKTQWIRPHPFDALER